MKKLRPGPRDRIILHGQVWHKASPDPVPRDGDDSQHGLGVIAWVHRPARDRPGGDLPKPLHHLRPDFNGLQVVAIDSSDERATQAGTTATPADFAQPGRIRLRIMERYRVGIVGPERRSRVSRAGRKW